MPLRVSWGTDRQQRGEATACSVAGWGGSDGGGPGTSVWSWRQQQDVTALRTLQRPSTGRPGMQGFRCAWMFFKKGREGSCPKGTFSSDDVPEVRDHSLRGPRFNILQAQSLQIEGVAPCKAQPEGRSRRYKARRSPVFWLQG